MIKVDNFQFPLIIAMEDHSGSQSNNGGKVSQELAKFLRCPLISENDVAEALQKFPLTTSSKSAKYQVPNELAQHLPFEAVIQIASTQLSLGINVVINTQLSHPANVEKLVQLESNGKARLIIIEFDTNDQHHNYNVGNVKKLLVDEESFDVEEKTIVVVCRREIDSRELFYRCEQRNLAIHMKCVPADPILADIPSRKKPTGLKFVKSIPYMKSIPYTEAQLRQIFKSADRNKDGLLSVRELSQAFKSLGARNPAFRAHRAMSIADSNRDGYIDGKELEDVIKYTLKIGYGPVDGIAADEDLRVQEKENNHI
ncbi:hypothetical protein GH714_005334 [Hevea brasiliensis]|uniref:EF-hand domain-containing protein n=1 Tax=Hevea brasiliensis TaxID=3981 RepID=A0A6A6MBG3_HEVBR|nr:hypothetical protein GH714_005334 [Hevea brasiliensis]